MARILAVGIATVDIINEVECYPQEDDEVRALSQTCRRGGNATNTLVVLSQLGHECEWAGVLVDEPGAELIKADLDRYRIGTGFCRHLAQGRMPVSYITLSRASASRTIVHHRDLPEFDFSGFREIPLEQFDWIHFEGRHVSETVSMMDWVRSRSKKCGVSLEIEKPRAGIEKLFPLADLILFSTAVANSRCREPEDLFRQVRQSAPEAILTCTLGAQGAIALDQDGCLFRSSGFAPPNLLDTIGAGDVFNAAMIDCLSRGVALQDALVFSCRLAGNKCGLNGFDGLVVADAG